MDRREQRRKRRIRNQIIIYCVAAVLLAAVGCGVFFGYRYLSEKSAEKKAAEAAQQESIAAEESLQAEEEAAREAAEAEAAEAAETSEAIMAETQTVPTQEEILEELVENCIANMTLEEKAAGVFMVTPEQITGVETAVKAGDGTKEALAKYPVGGLIYFAQNIQSEEQITEMLANTVSYSKYPLFLAVDEEGGTVARVADALKLADVGDMADIGAGGNAEAAYAAGAQIGEYLQKYGFNLDFAPVADVLTNPDNTVIGKRSFGNDPQMVSGMVSRAVQGLQEKGVSACVKHFPGHGDTAGDSHEGSVETTRSLEEMQMAEFLPFRAAMEVGVDLIMAGHISAPELTGGDSLPASMNEQILTGILREQLGYNGIIITDAMNMASISDYWTSDEAAVKALKAGADMILMPEDFETAYEGVIAAVQDGTIDIRRIEDSLRRIYRVKYADTLKE